MRKTKRQTPTDRILLTRNATGITRTLADLNAVCKHLNEAVTQLADRELLPFGLSDEIVRGMCFNDGSAIIAALKEAATTAPASTRFERRLTAQTLEEDSAAVTEILADLAQTIEKNRLREGMNLRDDERATYLKADGNAVTFSRDEVTEYFSEYADTPEAIEYIAEARRVFDTLAEFDRKTRILGNNRVRGIGDAAVGAIPEIISVYNGKIRLDLAAVADLVFEGAEERSKRMSFDNYETAKAIR